MKMRTLLIVTSFLALGGCVATGYTLVDPGTRTVGEKLSVNASAGWNLAPAYAAAGRKGAETWTQDGLLLDRLVFVPAIPDGQPIFTSNDKSAALPPFRKGMLPNEVEELMESSIVKYFGEGQAAVSTSNLRPHTFGEHRGYLFDIEAVVTDSPSYRGVVGAFIVDDELYIMWFVGAEPYYYGKHLAEAEAIIRSARLAAAAG